jgi:acyl carrier protein
MNRTDILDVVLTALRTANQARTPDLRLKVSPTARLFGNGSPLDSLGLVALLIDIEEAFEQRGQNLVLSDERALAQSRSPFRDVPALVDYIAAQLETGP